MAKLRMRVDRLNKFDKEVIGLALADIEPVDRLNCLAGVELRAMERGDQVVLDAIEDWRLEQRFTGPAAVN